MLGKRLIYLRKQKGLEPKDILKKFKFSSGRYSQYENGHRRPSFEILIEFAKFYNVSVDYLIGYSDTPAPLKTEFSFEEQQIIKKYRALDERGKNNVLQTLDNEYQYVEEYSQKKKQA